MDIERIARIVGRLTFLGAVAYVLFGLSFILKEYDTGLNPCVQQAQNQIHADKYGGYTTYGNYYFCLDTRTESAYFPKYDEALVARLKIIKSSLPTSYDPMVVEGMLANEINKATLANFNQGTLIAQWNWGEIFKTVAFCVFLIGFSFPLGFYLTKLGARGLQRLLR